MLTNYRFRISDLVITLAILISSVGISGASLLCSNLGSDKNNSHFALFSDANDLVSLTDHMLNYIKNDPISWKACYEYHNSLNAENFDNYLKEKLVDVPYYYGLDHMPSPLSIGFDAPLHLGFRWFNSLNADNILCGVIVLWGELETGVLRPFGTLSFGTHDHQHTSSVFYASLLKIAFDCANFNIQSDQYFGI
ncbi:MAG: hypothetical protein LBJ92_04870 [Holosporales bacterium]|jgi:hypothetical protein|nr:hypothetical protein [Holosporales bacterium]